MSETNNINIQLIKPLVREFPLSGNHISAFSCIAIEEYPIHSHLHMEVIYVVKGSLRVKVGVSDYILKEDEFTIINPFELHALYSSDEDNLTCILEINSDFYDPIAEETIFVSYYNLYRDAAGVDFDKIVNTLKRLFTLHLTAIRENTRGDTVTFPTCTNDSDAEYEKVLLRSLINYFELHFTSEFFLLSDHRENTLRDNIVQANRLKSIMIYFYEHFPQKIQLQDVADLTFVNRYHISHLVKEGIGYTFSELLQHIRIEKSEVYLLGTDMPINRIVFELGFSSYRYFSQHFKKLFHMTPTAYRKKYGPATIRHKELSYRHDTNASDLQTVLDILGCEHPAETGKQSSGRSPVHLIMSSEVKRLRSCRQPLTSVSDIVLPEKSLLYDSPYFPALMLHMMGNNIAGFIRRFPQFFSPETGSSSHPFTGLSGNITASGIRKSTFYLSKLLEPFIARGSVSLPGFLSHRSEDCIHQLFFNLPAEFEHLTTEQLSAPDILKRAEMAASSPERKWTAVFDEAGSNPILIEIHTLQLDLDAFIQWQRLGKPDFSGSSGDHDNSDSSAKNLSSLLNQGSVPQIRLEKSAISNLGASFDISLPPFGVRYIALRDFTSSL